MDSKFASLAPLRRRSEHESYAIGCIIQELYRLYRRNNFLRYLPLRGDPRKARYWKQFVRIRTLLRELDYWKHRKECIASVFDFYRAKYGKIPYPGQLATEWAQGCWQRRVAEINGGSAVRSARSRAEKALHRKEHLGKYSEDEQLMRSIQRALELTKTEVLKRPELVTCFSPKYLWKLLEYKKLRRSGFYKKEFGIEPTNKAFAETVLWRKLAS